jgi:hypothetical protein
MCGRVVSYPDGFELDHIERLDRGGADDGHNRQVLCVEWAIGVDGRPVKAGCHAAKTTIEGGGGYKLA